MEIYYTDLTISKHSKLLRVKGLSFRKVFYFKVSICAYIKGAWHNFTIPLQYDIDRGLLGKKPTYYEVERFYKDVISNQDYFHSQITHHLVSFIKTNYLTDNSDASIHNALNSFVMNKRFLGYLIL